MSVEETLQPSFTVTADTARPDGISQTSQSTDSYANGPVVGGTSIDTAAGQSIGGVVPETESLQQWTISQLKANESVGQQGRVDAEHEKGGRETETEINDRDTRKEVYTEDHSSPGPDIPEVAVDCAAKASEGEDVPSPINTPPPVTDPKPPSEQALPSVPPKTALTPAKHQNLQPINRYSPHRTANFNPSPAKGRTLFDRPRTSAVQESQDSFAEDGVKHRQQVQPAEKLKRVMEHYASTSTRMGLEDDDDNADEGGGLAEEKVPGWEESEMRPGETLGADPAADSHGEGLVFGEQKDAKNRETRHGKVNDDTADRQAPNDSPRGQITTSSPPPSPAPNRISPSPPLSPEPRRNGFNTLLESESSLGMPSEMHFSQDDEMESQHSTHSLVNVATQSLQRNIPHLSSPPLSPPRESTVYTHSDPRSCSHSHSHPSTDPNTQSHSHLTKGQGTTQEATQLVTEDELIGPRSASPPIFPVRRVLPTARARLEGRAVISQPADRSRPLSAGFAVPHTIGAPPGRLLARRTPPVPVPAVLEDTFVDHTQQGDADIQDVDMASSSVINAQEVNEDGKAAQSTPPVESAAISTNHSSSSAQVDLPVTSEPTYVDPTLTSLPPPPPKRPTPVKYGAKANGTRHNSPIPPSHSTSTPSGPTPPPTAGPSRSPVSSSPDPLAQAPPESAIPARAPTKSGRIPKRKRRESSASLSSSSSSSEDVDMYDDSYRPTLSKPLKTKTRSKATNPNLKRVKQGTRSRSGSHTTSTSTSGKERDKEKVKGKGKQKEVTPSTEVSESSDLSNLPERPFVLACWYPNWFLGRVRGIEQGKYDVDYEDGTHSLVAIDKVRRGVLEVGDRVKSEDHKNEEFTVIESWDGDERGIKVKGQSHRLPLSRVYIRQAIIKADFQDRIISPQDLGYNVDPPTITKPATNTSTKSISTTSDIFSGKIFFITSASSGLANRNNQKDAATLIGKNGGKFAEKWYDLFDLPSSGFGSTLASTSAPFLIQETSQASLTPKVLVSLAKGIPCLSMAYLDDALSDPSVDWRSYLVESGFSERLQQHCSQVVDARWGGQGWNAAIAQAERRPFMGKRFLFLEPREKDKREIKRLILVCLHAMGAIAVDCVQAINSSKECDGYDYILVEDRDKKRDLPNWLKGLDRVCNIPWLKQCLIMGAPLQPDLLKDK